MTRTGLGRAILFLAGAMTGSAQLVSIDTAQLPLAEAERGTLSAATQAGEWLAVEAELFRHVRAHPDSAALRKALAAAHFRNERYLAAASEYGKAARLERLDAASRFTLVAAYVALDRRHWARRELEALAAEYPRNPLYPHWLAGIFQHYQWFDEAIVQARKALELRPDYGAARDRLGQCLEALGRTEEALTAYAEAERAGRAAGDLSPWASFHLGSLLRQSGRLSEALAALRRAVSVDGQNAEVQHELGLTLEQLDRGAEALQALEAAARLAPGTAKFHYAVHRLRRRMGDLDGARLALEKFREITAR